MEEAASLRVSIYIKTWELRWRGFVHGIVELSQMRVAVWMSDFSIFEAMRLLDRFEPAAELFGGSDRGRKTAS
jgi:hypothetical protein